MIRGAVVVTVALLALASSAIAQEPELDLQNGKFRGVFIGAPMKEFNKAFHGGEWIGTWRAFREKGYFLQPAALRNMAGFSMGSQSWPARTYGFADYAGAISFGLDSRSTLDGVIDALRKGFGGAFVVTLEEERGVWNRQFIAYQLTGWKTDPPFYFDIFFGKDKRIEEIRLKGFPGAYYPDLLLRRATGPDAIEKKLPPRPR